MSDHGHRSAHKVAAARCLFEVTLGFAPAARLQHMVVHKPLFQLSPSMMEAWCCVVSCV